MKRLFLLGCMLAVLVAPASAQLPANAYIGLFIDEARTNWCVSGLGAHTMYLVVLPSQDGLLCTEMSTTLVGTGVMFFQPTWNPLSASPVMGGIPGDLGHCFDECQTDWVYLCSVSMLVQTTDPVSIEIGAYTGVPYPRTLVCDESAEPEAIPFTTFYINGCGPLGVEESSWGAIKSLYE
jgi:hypothetical protein